MNADEELDAQIRDMEKDSNVLRAEMRRIEDEHSAERTQYKVIVQSARDEWAEFNKQYNHVIGCWREAEEKSRRFESEFQSEAMSFHEARNGLHELQQHMGNAVQEDYGAAVSERDRELFHQPGTP